MNSFASNIFYNTIIFTLSILKAGGENWIIIQTCTCIIFIIFDNDKDYDLDHLQLRYRHLQISCYTSHSAQVFQKESIYDL